MSIQKKQDFSSEIARNIGLEEIKNGGFDCGTDPYENRLKTVDLIYKTALKTANNPHKFYKIKGVNVSGEEVKNACLSLDRVALDYIIWNLEERENSPCEKIKNYEAYIRSCIYETMSTNAHIPWSEQFFELNFGFYWTCWQEDFQPEKCEENSQKAEKFSDNFSIDSIVENSFNTAKNEDFQHAEIDFNSEINTETYHEKIAFTPQRNSGFTDLNLQREYENFRRASV